MSATIGCDAHKQFSVFVAIDDKGKTSPAVRVEHHRQEYIDFLHSLPPQSEIALEATGHWYWMVEMEKAGHRPHLANPTEAKKRMGKTNKTDALDAKGLAILLHNGTLPESWIPPGELRDRRELLRTRMALRDLRSSLKHRIHAAIDRYGLQATGISDLFGVKGRVYIDAVLNRLPCDTAAMILVQLTSLDQFEVQIEEIEERIATALKPSPEVKLLRTVPGVGEILAPLVWLEIGEVERFQRAENLASYAGLVPRIIASGGRIRHGGTCRNVNHYLKWGFVEAATCAVRLKAYRESHVGLLYHRLAPVKGHGRAIIAVARHHRRRSPSRRSKLLGAAQTAVLQGSSAASHWGLNRFVQVRLNARHV
jgi:transposase